MKVISQDLKLDSERRTKIRRRKTMPDERDPTTVMPAQDLKIGDTLVRLSGQGFPLVFVHGFTTTSEFWREQADEFAKSYRVIRINLPGHGASPAPTARSYRIEDFVQDVERVFRELSVDTAVLIGLSMGGIIAQQFAIKYPHLVKALVLVDTTAHGTGADGTADAFLAAVDKRGAEKAIQHLSDISFGSSAGPALVEWARQEVIQTPEFVARAAIRSISDADTRNSLSRIKQPTLVIAGEEDVVTPTGESEILAKGIGNSTLSIIPKAGHFSMLEKPGVFNGILRGFLDEQSLGSS
jgi:3-oxoadipate enol-lactonase